MSEKVYVMSCGEYMKIGIATSIVARRSSIQAGNPEIVRVEYYVNRSHARPIERRAHEKLLHKHHRGEWFKCTVDEAIDAVKSAIVDYEDSKRKDDLVKVDINLKKGETYSQAITAKKKDSLMELIEWFGGYQNTIGMLRVTKQTLHNWIKRGAISKNSAIDAEYVTNGVFTKEQLRPDVLEWETK